MDKLKNRDYFIDFLRFCAIVLMVFAHSGMIIHLELNKLNGTLQGFGNTVCFVFFLFCFGASAYYSTKNSQITVLTTIRRILPIYFAHLIAGVLILIETNNLTVGNFFNIVIFKDLPGYGEFFASFIVLYLLFVLVRPFILFLTNNLSYVMLASVLGFLISTSLHAVTFPGYLKPYVALFVNQPGIYSFPIFSYLIFFLGGVYYAQNVNKINLKFLTVSTLVLLLSYLVGTQVNLFGQFSIMGRWPVNLRFILYGLVSLFLFLHVYRIITLRKGMKETLYQISLPINKYVLHIFYFHLIILFLLKWTFGLKSYIINYILTLVILIPFYLLYNKTINEKTPQ